MPLETDNVWAIDVVEGVDLGARFVLPAGSHRLGRGPRGLSDPHVSRAHLEVRAGRNGVAWRHTAVAGPAGVAVSRPRQQNTEREQSWRLPAGEGERSNKRERSGKRERGANRKAAPLEESRGRWQRWHPGDTVRIGHTTLCLRRLPPQGVSNAEAFVAERREGLSCLSLSPLAPPLPAQTPSPGRGSPEGGNMLGQAAVARGDAGLADRNTWAEATPGSPTSRSGWSLAEEREHLVSSSPDQAGAGWPGSGRTPWGAPSVKLRRSGRVGAGPSSRWLARLAMPLLFMLAWPLLRTGGWRRALLVVGGVALTAAFVRWVGAPIWRRFSTRVQEYRVRRQVRCDPAKLLYSVLPALAIQTVSFPGARFSSSPPGVARHVQLNLAPAVFSARKQRGEDQPPSAAVFAPGRAWTRVREGTVLGTVGDEGLGLALWISVQALCLGWRVEWVAPLAGPQVAGTGYLPTAPAARPNAALPASPDEHSPAEYGYLPRIYLAWAPTEAQLPACQLLQAAGPLPGASWLASAHRFWAARVFLPFPAAESDQRFARPHRPSAPSKNELQRGAHAPAGTSGSVEVAASSPAAGSEPPDPFALCPLGRAELAFARANPRLRAPIGLGDCGPVYLDLERDGPHALIAGRTGSGKSEFLTFYLSALALRNPPAALNFVLFDYKGGATFTPLLALPHTVAVLTDLDGAAGERALQALQAELGRRERLLTEFGLREVNQLPADRRPAALVVAVDEFRVLKDHHPQFLATLLRLAAQGRSLGMHLVLSTQRPAGAISPEIAANTSIRICLRVSTDVDSRDVLGHPDACYLPSPGAALVQTDGESRIFTPALGSGPSSWRELSWQTCVELGGEAARPLWAPPLPHSISVESVSCAATPYPAVVVDDVAAQAWSLVFGPQRSILVAGGAGSGKSLACSQLAASAWAAGADVCVVARPSNPAWQPWWQMPGIAGVDSRDARHLDRLLQWWEGLSPGALEGAVLVVDDADQVETPGSTRVDSLVRAFHSLGGTCVVSCSQSRNLARLAPGRLLLPGAPPELLPRLGASSAASTEAAQRPLSVPDGPGAGLWLDEKWGTCQVTLPSVSVASSLREQTTAGVHLDAAYPAWGSAMPGPLAHAGAESWTALNPRLPAACSLAELAATAGPERRGQSGAEAWLGIGLSPTGPVWVPSPVAVIGQPGRMRDLVEAGLRRQLACPPAAPPPPTSAPGEPDSAVVALSAEEALGAIRGPAAAAKTRGALVFVGPLTRAARALSPVELGESSIHRDGVIVLYRSVREVRLCKELSGIGMEHCPQYPQGEATERQSKGAERVGGHEGDRNDQAGND